MPKKRKKYQIISKMIDCKLKLLPNTAELWTQKLLKQIWQSTDPHREKQLKEPQKKQYSNQV